MDTETAEAMFDKLMAEQAKVDALAASIKKLWDGTPAGAPGWSGDGPLKGVDFHLPMDDRARAPALQILARAIVQSSTPNVVELQHGERAGKYALTVRLAA